MVPVQHFAHLVGPGSGSEGFADELNAGGQAVLMVLY
jgi:hypothetical protein